jgi:hypothetical protein
MASASTRLIDYLLDLDETRLPPTGTNLVVDGGRTGITQGCF